MKFPKGMFQTFVTEVSGLKNTEDRCRQGIRRKADRYECGA
jgi:hypothetical protein